MFSILRLIFGGGLEMCVQVGLIYRLVFLGGVHPCVNAKYTAVDRHVKRWLRGAVGGDDGGSIEDQPNHTNVGLTKLG